MIDVLEKYNEELEQDIESLERYIEHDEELAKLEFQTLGCPQEIANEIAKDRRAKDRHMYCDYPGCLGSDEALAILKELIKSVKVSPFRIYLCAPAALHCWETDKLAIKIIRKDGHFWFNTIALSDAETKMFVDIMRGLIKIYLHAHEWSIKHCYPSPQMMLFVTQMLTKYKEERLLINMPVRDDRVYNLW